MKIDSSSFILRNLNSTRSKLQSSFQKLSSGNRLSAKDDPARLAISEGLESQVRALQMTNRNISYEQSSLRTEEGRLSQVSSDLQRLRELAVQSANGTLSDSDRANLQAEFEQIQQSIQSGTSHTNLPELDIQELGVASQEGAEDALQGLDQALSQVSSYRSELGAHANSLEYRSQTNSIQAENLAGANSELRDTDYAEELSELSRLRFLQEAQAKTLKAQQEANKEMQFALFKQKT